MRKRRRKWEEEGQRRKGEQMHVGEWRRTRRKKGKLRYPQQKSKRHWRHGHERQQPTQQSEERIKKKSECEYE